MSKVVILLSTYNGEKYLDEQLSSIFNQSCNCEIELVVRDDGSIDNTLEILKKWENKINVTYVSDGVNLGAAKSFWKLLKNSPDADFYAFVDQDDIWKKEKLAVAINSLSIDKPQLWFSNCNIINHEGTVIENQLHLNTPILTIQSQLICGSAQGCSMVFTKKLRDIVISKDYKTIPMHDLIVMIGALIHGEVVYENTPHFSYRVHSNNVIAKQGKTLATRISKAFNQWFIKDKYLISTFAREILEVESDFIDESTKKYLQCLSSKKIQNRVYLLRNKETRSTKRRALYTFKIKTILGII